MNTGGTGKLKKKTNLAAIILSIVYSLYLATGIEPLADGDGPARKYFVVFLIILWNAE